MEREEGLLKGCSVESPGANKIFLLGWEDAELCGTGWCVWPQGLYPRSRWIQ